MQVFYSITVQAMLLRDLLTRSAKLVIKLGLDLIDHKVAYVLDKYTVDVNILSRNK